MEDRNMRHPKKRKDSGKNAIQKKQKKCGESLVELSFCKNENSVVDEIKATNVSVHIERMNDGEYWMRIGESEFDASTKKRGKLIIVPRIRK